MDADEISNRDNELFCLLHRLQRPCHSLCRQGLGFALSLSDKTIDVTLLDTPQHTISDSSGPNSLYP